MASLKVWLRPAIGTRRGEHVAQEWADEEIVQSFLHCPSDCRNDPKLSFQVAAHLGFCRNVLFEPDDFLAFMDRNERKLRGTP